MAVLSAQYSASTLRKMRAFIVGSTSAIGRAVAADLTRRGADVVMVGRRDADVPLNLAEDVPDELRGSGGRPVLCDLVVNAAATTRQADQAQDSTAWVVNAEGAGAVARLAAAAGARHVIHLSTVYAGCPASYPGPASYPRSKAAGEEAAATEARRGATALTVLRLTHVYDASGTCRPNQELPYRFADLAEMNQPIEIHGDGTARRDYLHLDDAVRAVRLAATSKATGTVTVGSPEMMTVSEIADAARHAFGSTSPLRFHRGVRGPASMPPFDSSGGWQVLGGAPTIGIAEGFRLMRLARAA